MSSRFYTEENIAQKIRIATAIEKCKRLQEFAEKLAVERGNGNEELETFLYLLIHLKERQNLPFDIDKMQFIGCAQADENDIQKADAYLNNIKVQNLYTKSPLLQDYLFNLTENAKSKAEAIYESAAEKVSDLMENVQKSNLTEQERLKEIRQIETARKKALEDLTEELVQQAFKPTNLDEEEKKMLARIAPQIWDLPLKGADMAFVFRDC